ncbi:hypothetical protein BRADI_4g43933v3 [Brachypodium distachyon]|uniref:Uncharacterized protein n=1 Tax=Brachypodium distachyon TaxID=15368 RepID=A0A2K2CU19_BRADI|nr:hypothetical protein BRADI_4g43933v3 [Brachypodium distachyon]
MQELVSTTHDYSSSFSCSKRFLTGLWDLKARSDLSMLEATAAMTRSIKGRRKYKI